MLSNQLSANSHNDDYGMAAVGAKRPFVARRVGPALEAGRSALRPQPLRGRIVRLVGLERVAGPNFISAWIQHRARSTDRKLALNSLIGLDLSSWGRHGSHRCKHLLGMRIEMRLADHRRR
jgi:hypothetical protein